MQTNLEAMKSEVLNTYDYLIEVLGKGERIVTKNNDKHIICYLFVAKVKDKKACNFLFDAYVDTLYIYISGNRYGIGTTEEKAFMEMLEGYLVDCESHELEEQE